MTAERRVLLTLLRPIQPEVVLEEVDHHCLLLALCVVTCCGLVRLCRHHSDVGIESEFFRLGRGKGSGQDVGALGIATGTGCLWRLLELEWRGQVRCWPWTQDRCI